LRTRPCAFFHTGITVPDLDEAKRLFVDVFRLELISERLIHGPYLAHMLGQDSEISARIAMLKVDQSTFLELVEYRNKTNALPTQVVQRDITISGVPHLAFFVENLEHFHAQHGDNDLRPLSSTHDVIPRGPFAGGLIRFYRTKFECLIEIIQQPNELVS